MPGRISVLYTITEVGIEPGIPYVKESVGDNCPSSISSVGMAWIYIAIDINKTFCP
jgi:hypothetical protein